MNPHRRRVVYRGLHRISVFEGESGDRDLSGEYGERRVLLLMTRMAVVRIVVEGAAGLNL